MAASASVDVVVVGGGPAGSTVAALLARAGREVLLCEAARLPRHKPCGEYIPPAAIPIFSLLGVLEEIWRLGPRRLTGMAVVAPCGARVLGRYGDRAPAGLSLRRFDLDQALIQNARRCGAEVLQACRVTGIDRGRDGLFHLALVQAGPEAAADGERKSWTVRARAVVGADGRNSLVARALGLRRAAPHHRRWAIVGRFRDVRAPADHGEMIVTPYGYCGINPLPEGLANVSIIVDPRRPRGRLPGKAGILEFFRERIASHPLSRLRMARARLAGDLRAIGPMACRASRVVADGVLLVGDAAGFYDPFTGEGISMALRGGVMAAEVLDASLRQGDLRAQALWPYEAARRAAFGARLRLDRILQSVLVRPWLADRVARKLVRDPGLADLLARVTGDTADASEVFRPRFLARLLLA